MPRHPAKGEAARSQKWIQITVNTEPELLSERVAAAFRWATDRAITWLSPLQANDYAEYSDGEFLELLGLGRHKARLADFWPPGGPHCDALGRTKGGRIVLVEAKAHIAELLSGGSGAGVASLDRIRRALVQTRISLGAGNQNDWDAEFFQAANRIAHLHFLRDLCGEEAFLVYACFVNAPDAPKPATEGQWQGALDLLDAYLGASNHRLKPFKAAVFVSPTEDLRMLSNSEVGRPGSLPAAPPDC